MTLEFCNGELVMEVDEGAVEWAEAYCKSIDKFVDVTEHLPDKWREEARVEYFVRLLDRDDYEGDR